MTALLMHERDLADVLRESTEAAVAGAAAAAHRAEVLVRESQRLRWPTEISWPRMFVVRGEVEGRKVRAVWSRGSLVCSSALLERGEVLVAMGEEFGLDSGGPVLVAGFDDATAAMLTLMRACDHVHTVQFSPVIGPDVREGKKAPERVQPFRLFGSLGAVAVVGEVDRHCVERFRISVTEAVRELEWPVLDLGGLRVVDAEGAVALAELLRSTRAVARNVSAGLHRMWDLLGLDAGLIA